MDEVAERLFVGTVEDAGDAALVRKHGVTNVVSLTHSTPDGGFPAGLTVVNVPMMDGPRNDQQRFERAVTRSVACLEAGESLLVQCSAGGSRSPAVAATALALTEDLPLEEAFDRVIQRREAADPHRAIVQQAERTYNSLKDNYTK